MIMKLFCWAHMLEAFVSYMSFLKTCFYCMFISFGFSIKHFNNNNILTLQFSLLLNRTKMLTKFYTTVLT